MHYILESSKNVAEVAQNLQDNITANGFGVLHIHNLEETMHNKGIELGEACQIFEICNPQLAKEVLSEDMDMNMILPCRISVYTHNGTTKVGMINPTSLMQESTHAKELVALATTVETKAKEIINKSV